MNQRSPDNKPARAILVLALLYTSCFSFAQGRSPITEYSTENGLSINSINDLLFDKQGFLWIATADGLQRFDGYHFQTFKRDDRKQNSLSSNQVIALYEDEQSNLWLTNYLGLQFKPKGKFQFTVIPYPHGINGNVYPGFFSGEDDSSVWVLQYPQGMYAINKFTLVQTKIADLPPDFQKGGIEQLLRIHTQHAPTWFRKSYEKAGDLLRFTAGGFQQYKNTRKEVVLFIIPEKDSITVITDQVIYRAPENNPFVHSRILQEHPGVDKIDKTFMTGQYKINERQWLLSSLQNTLAYNLDKDTLLPFVNDALFAGDINKYLHSVAIDDYQNTWFGFNGVGGLKVFPSQKFERLKRPDDNALPYCMAPGDDGKLYVGVYQGDIEVYDRDMHFKQLLRLPEPQHTLSSPRSMAFIDPQNLLVKRTVNELYVVNVLTNKVVDLSHFLPADMDSIFKAEFESDMQKIGDNEILLSHKKKILSLKKEKDSFHCALVCTLPANERITSFYQKKDGSLWIGTVGGAWYFNKTIQRLPMPPCWVKHVAEDPRGDIWFTTTDGIFIFRDNKLLRQLNIKDGLPNSFVYGVLFDGEGNGWLSSNKGITKIDTAYRIIAYTSKQGLQGEEFNTKCYCKGADGLMYFGGVNGINFFNPRQFKTGTSKTMLTAVEVNNQVYQPGVHSEFIHTIDLPYYQNNIKLSFANMDLTDPAKNQFRFWLKGFQSDWSSSQTNNTVQYILPPGDYQLLVLGANHEGLWNTKPLLVNIIISPPWYRTLWAKILFTLLILGTVALTFYYISKIRYRKKLRTLEMQQEMQKEKQRLSRDLHDNLGSQITWLSNNISQVERIEERSPVEKQKIGQLKEGIGDLMQTLRETIWILNKDSISCIDLFDKVVSYAARYIEAYPPLQLHSEENIKNNIQLSSGQTLQLFRMCQEAVTNVCKHSGADKLSITANTSDHQFTIIISDNGKGFDPDNNLDGHYGLQNMKERAKESNLQLAISSSWQKGTSISISLQQEGSIVQGFKGSKV